MPLILLRSSKINTVPLPGSTIGTFFFFVYVSLFSQTADPIPALLRSTIFLFINATLASYAVAWKIKLEK